MARLAFALGLAAVVSLSPATLRAQTMWDVENARANARAGGPISAYDADILRQYGCLSGTRSAFCRKLNHQQRRSGRRSERSRR